MKLRIMVVMIACIFVWQSVPGAEICLFFEDFEGDLSQWVGRDGEPHSASIVEDPLDPSNKVVVFSERTGYGDIFSLEFPIVEGYLYVLYVRYLGIPGGEGTDPYNLGGFAGIGDDTFLPYNGHWLGGTYQMGGYPQVEFIDDGTWHTYAIIFDPFEEIPLGTTLLRLVLEDWDGGIGIAGDAYFDQIRVVKYEGVSVESGSWGRIKALSGE